MHIAHDLCVWIGIILGNCVSTYGLMGAVLLLSPFITSLLLGCYMASFFLDRIGSPTNEQEKQTNKKEEKDKGKEKEKETGKESLAAFWGSLANLLGIVWNRLLHPILVTLSISIFYPVIYLLLWTTLSLFIDSQTLLLTLGVSAEEVDSGGGSAAWWVPLQELTQCIGLVIVSAAFSSAFDLRKDLGWTLSVPVLFLATSSTLFACMLMFAVF